LHGAFAPNARMEFVSMAKAKIRMNKGLIVFTP
jgi:hypothetical protein